MIRYLGELASRTISARVTFSIPVCKYDLFTAVSMQMRANKQGANKRLDIHSEEIRCQCIVFLHLYEGDATVIKSALLIVESLRLYIAKFIGKDLCY